MSATTLTERFLRLPRAAQWVLLAAAFTLAFLAWDETLRRLVDSWDDQSGDILRKIEEVRSSQQIAEDLEGGRTKDLISAFGPVERPGDKDQGRTALDDAVNAVIHNPRLQVTSQSSDPTDGGRLPQDASAGVTEGNMRLKQIGADFSFEASPERAIAAIAQLERSPAVECISSVRITKAGAGKVKVRLTLESWVVDK